MSNTNLLNKANDRRADLEAFDSAKTGVKGLVDSKITEVPRVFLHPPDMIPLASPHQFIFPTVDLDSISTDKKHREKVISEVRSASETWGFFQVVNHGVDETVLKQMETSVRRFFESEHVEAKKKWYIRDYSQKFVYNSNFDLFSSDAAAVNWRDTFYCEVQPNPPKPEGLPEEIREILMDFSNQVKSLGARLFELLSEALGLQPNYLNSIGCDDGMAVLGHYYPACPEPELTMGTPKHADADFITVLLQDQVGGLQIVHENHWVALPPVEGALVVNIGDLVQLISNDRFKSVEHRVLATSVPRVLCYLHDECSRPIIHRDVKSSNILLSDTLEPQLCDFGLAIWGPTTSPCLTKVDIVGTFGYLAPEYFMYGKVSDKIDVYSYGVVLLELLSGKKPICSETGQESLVMWVRTENELSTIL